MNTVSCDYCNHRASLFKIKLYTTGNSFNKEYVHNLSLPVCLAFNIGFGFHEYISQIKEKFIIFVCNINKAIYLLGVCVRNAHK